MCSSVCLSQDTQYTLVSHMRYSVMVFALWRYCVLCVYVCCVLFIGSVLRGGCPATRQASVPVPSVNPSGPGLRASGVRTKHRSGLFKRH